MDREQTMVEGVIESVVHHNEANSFTVLRVHTKDGEIDCVGKAPLMRQGETVRLLGTFTVHSVYGRQFHIAQCERVMPETEDGMIQYLGSGVVRGIRERMAKKIVEHFGKETFSVIENEPERLASIKGITLEKAYSISTVFHEQSHMRRVILYLQDLGVSVHLSSKIYNKYKENAYEVVQSNPYKLAEEVLGISFKLADHIAARSGLTKDSPYRIQAAVKYCLYQASINGHTYLPVQTVIEQTCGMLELLPEIIENHLSQMQLGRTIWREEIDGEQAVFLSLLYYAENYVAKKLVSLSENTADRTAYVEERIRRMESSAGFLLAQEQKRAVAAALNSGVLVITGGPGTGKTTTIRTIIQILQEDGYEIELAAPTGRAAKRMSEATGMEAKTLHRLLEIAYLAENGRNQTFGRNRDHPLEADVIIVDESSMMDILLMNSLLDAVPEGSRLILVGDVDQLPSVGPGNVLKDIISSECIHVVRLNEIFRQAGESAIVTNAHRINRGEYPIINEKNSDFFFTRRVTPDQVVHAILDLASERLPNYMHCNSVQDIQILAPMRKSSLGVGHLNEQLQERLNPPRGDKKEYVFRNTTFREGDKVMQTKNNYNLSWKVHNQYGQIVDEGTGIFNGDCGVIKRIDEFHELLTVVFDDRKVVNYDFTQLEEIELSYAITIHKAQGSEYRIVVMPIYSGPPMLMSRNLLYTGVTRAKELCVIVGAAQMLNQMVDNNREVNRYSSLRSKIKKMKAFMTQDGMNST